MTTPIRLPDGSEVEIATDDPKQAAAVARKILASRQQPKAAPTPKRGVMGTIGDAIGDISDNILPNWGDEIYAAGAATRAFFEGKDTGKAFEEGQARFKRNQQRYDQEHPTAAWGTTLGGAGLSLALPAGRVVANAPRAVRMAHGAAVGAGYGAVSGAGEGDGVAERATNAGRGGAIGAGFGAAAAPVADAAVAGGRWVRQNVPGVDGAARRLGNVPRAILQRPRVQPGQRAQEQGNRLLAREMERGNIQTGMGQHGAPSSPQAIVAEQERRQAMGVPAIPGDVTEPMRDLTSWASRGMGPGQSRVRQALDARKASESGRVRQHVIDEFGPVGDPLLQVEQHVQRAKDQAAPMYREAYAQPMVITPEIEGIMQTPAFREALPDAVRNIRNAQRDPAALGFRLDEVGNISGLNTLSTEGFDQVIRAMRDAGRSAADVNPLTGRVINNTNSVHINARAGDLRGHLADQNDPYREVTERYADDMAQRDAFVNGQDVQGLTGHEINAQSRAMPENAQGAWSIGARTSLADEASRFGAKSPTGDTAAHLRKALGDDVKQQAIGQMTGNTGAVRGLQERLEAEHQGNILWKEVHGNSKTAPRQQLDADLDEAAGGRPLSSLTARGVLGGVIDFIGQRATAQFRNDVKARIAQVAAETNPATVRELMAEIAARAQHDREFADLLHRSGIIAAKAYGANIEHDNN